MLYRKQGLKSTKKVKKTKNKTEYVDAIVDQENQWFEREGDPLVSHDVTLFDVMMSVVARKRTGKPLHSTNGHFSLRLKLS